jgi:threonine synthase
VPSGNFGNLTAGLVAKRLGLPIATFVAATNVNDAVPVYLRTGEYRPRGSVRTVANAMDVGAPSNFERMQAMYGGSLDALRHDVAGVAYTDAQVVDAIGDVSRRFGYVLDPHGAIGWLAIDAALAEAGPDAQGVFLATAHPAKFREVVEPAIGRPVALPAILADALKRPRHSLSLAADYEALKALLRG